MRAVNKGRMFFTGFLLTFALIFIILSFGYKPNSRLVPLLVGMGTLIIGVTLLVNEIHPIRLMSKLDISVMDLGGEVRRDESDERGVGKKVLSVTAWFTAFFVIVFLLGFHVGVGLFTFTFLRFHGRVSWLKAGITAAVLFGSIFFLFEVALGFKLFRGVLFGELMPLI